MKFLDTNILVYVADIRDPLKQRIAEDLVTTALGTDGFLISEHDVELPAFGKPICPAQNNRRSDKGRVSMPRDCHS